MIDQETFTIRDLATGTNYVFEFDNNGVVLAGHVAIPFLGRASPRTRWPIGSSRCCPANVPGLTAVNLGDGVVNLGGNLVDLALVFEPGLPLVASGLRGAQTPHVASPVLPQRRLYGARRGDRDRRRRSTGR